MRSSVARKVLWLQCGVLLLSVLLLIRLYDLQIIRGEYYAARSETQQGIHSDADDERGTIFFQNKSGALSTAAGSEFGYTIALQPNKIENRPELFARLSKSVPSLSEAKIAQALQNTTDPYEEVASRVLKAEIDALIAAGVPKGVLLLRDSWRAYPGKKLAAHTIGLLRFENSSSTKQSGAYGLERSYDEALSKPSTGSGDSFTRVGVRLFGKAKEPGADLITNIEPTVQSRLEEILGNYNSTWNPTEVGGIILDPKTGAVIAATSLPTFDPSDVKATDVNTLSNPLVEKVYEFGSTMKPITMASAIDAGEVTSKTTYNDTGSVTIQGKKVSNYDGRARGVVPVQEILSQSLNVGIAFLVNKLGPEEMHNYLQKFGLTEETGIDLPGEASPLTSNIDTDHLLELTNAGFGQGIAVTPFAMARALSVLANDGSLVQPHVGKFLSYPGGIEKTLGWSPERRVVSEKAAKETTDMLVKVVDSALKNGAARNDQLTIAAKTGTAQIPSPKGGYYTDRYLHSFFTYFPADNPKFLVFFYAVAPQGALYAADTWTESFKSITTFLISYYQIPPNRNTPNTVQ